MQGFHRKQINIWISEIIFASSNNAEYYIVIDADTRTNSTASAKWAQIVSAARSYPYAQHYRDKPKAENWPNSKYGIVFWEDGTDNNSNTFAREMARVVGSNADVVPGWHPGNRTPVPVKDYRPTPSFQE